MNTEHRSIARLAIVVAALTAVTAQIAWACSAPWWIVPLAVVGLSAVALVVYFDKTEGGGMWNNAGDGGGFGDGGG